MIFLQLLHDVMMFTNLTFFCSLIYLSSIFINFKIITVMALRIIVYCIASISTYMYSTCKFLSINIWEFDKSLKPLYISNLLFLNNSQPSKSWSSLWLVCFNSLLAGNLFFIIASASFHFILTIEFLTSQHSAKTFIFAIISLCCFDSLYFCLL